MAKFSEYNSAARFKEAVYQIASKAIDDTYARPRYATVTAVNHAAGKITLRYPDDATDVVLSSTVIAPEVGAVVRIAGLDGARYVDEIQSGDTRIRGNLNVTGRLTVPGIDITGVNNTLSFSDGTTISTNGDATWLRVNRQIYSPSVIAAGSYMVTGDSIRLGSAALSVYGTARITGNLTLDTSIINGYTMSTVATANTIACREGSGYLNARYFNMTADVVAGCPPYMAGGNGDNYLRWYDRNGTFRVNRLEGSVGGGTWLDAAICANVGNNTVATLALHPGTYATTLFTTAANGNAVFVRDGASTGGSGTVVAGTYSADSTRRIKKNITQWPLLSIGAGVVSAADQLAKLNPITFQWSSKLLFMPPLRRSKALARLNAYLASKGRTLYEHPEHDCAIHECIGTAESPCPPKLMAEKMRYGFVAEEVMDVFPEAVTLDEIGLPAGIEYNQLIVVSIAAIQELTERIKVLEGAQ